MAYTEDVNINLNVLAGAMGGITAIMGGMSALTSTFGQFGTEAVDNFGAIDGLLVTTTALLASFGVQAAESFGQFEQGMRVVQTVSGQSSAAVAQLGEQANQLSVHYRTAINDITDGLQTLGRAGLNSANTQLEVLESGLQTAKLEGRNLNSVLEEIIQNTAMLGGDLKSIDFGKQSEYLNSLMVGTSMTAPINSHDISQTLQYAGGTAAAAGANLDSKDKLEDLMGTIAAFAQKGVTGSMSGTALRAFFTKPASQDKSVVDALGKLGLSPDDLWEDGGNSMKKVSDQVGIIQRRMDALHLSTIDQVELWGKMVGPKMGQQMMKLDSSSIKELTRDIQSAQSAQELANQTLHTYNQKLAELQQRGDVAFRGVGEHAVGVLTPVLDILNMIAGVLEHPAASFTAFWASMALVAHGVRAAWGMIKSVSSQIMGLIRNIDTAMTNLAGSSEGFTGGLAHSTSQADLLNMKLKETNATMQAIQAKAMNITGTSWVANGGKPGEKVNPGVVSSMSQNVFMGGKTESGLKIGKEGQYYTMADRAEIKEEAVALSEKNKLAQEQYMAQQDEVAANTQKLRDKVGALNKDITALTNRRSGLLEKLNYYKGTMLGGPSNTPITNIGDFKDGGYVPNALRSVSFLKNKTEQELNVNSEIQHRKKVLEDANITEADIQATKELMAAKKQLEKELRTAQQTFMANEEDRIQKRIDKNHEKYSPDDKKYIGHKAGDDGEHYLHQSLYDPNKKNSSINKFNQKYEADIAKLDAMNKELNSVKSKLILSTDTTFSPEALALQERADELTQLEKEIWAYGKQNIDSLLMGLEEERTELLAKIQASEMAPMMTQAGLEAMFPTASTKEINQMMTSLSTEMQTQITVMEENIYKKEMQRLEAAALKGDGIAALSYSQNKELERENASKIGGTNYRQFVSNTPAAPTPSVIVAQAQKTLVNGISKEMALAQDQLNKQVHAALYGQQKTGIRAKLQDSANKSLQSYTNILSGAKQRLSEFNTSLTWSKRGFEALSASQKQSQYAKLREAMVGIEAGSMTTEQALLTLSEKTGFTVAQMEALFQKAESLAIAFDQLQTKTATGTTATREDVKNTITGVIASGEGGPSGILGKITGKAGSAISSIVGFMGGPFMAGMMAFSAASSIFQQSVSNWQKTVSDAQNAMSESKDKLSTAEENIRELYSSENNQISEADLDKITDYQIAAIQSSYDADLDKHGKKTDPKFGDMYNNEVIKVEELNWSKEDKDKPLQDQLKTSEDLEKLNESTETLSLTEEENIKKLEENTVALNSATYVFSQALNKEAKAFNDPMYGYQGFNTKLQEASGTDGIWNYIPSIHSVLSLINEAKRQIWSEGYFEHNTGILSEYQKSDNFAGSTDFAPALSYRMYTEGSEEGLRNFFGNDFNNLAAAVDHINQKSGSMLSYMGSASNNGFQSMDSDDMAMAQMLWKEDPETMQKLGKQIFRYEQERGIDSGHSAMEDWQSGKLKHKKPGNDAQHPSANKNVYKDIAKKKYTVTDKNLKATMDKIYRMTDGKLSYANILALGQLQMFSDMLNVANEQIYPALSEQLIAAQQNVLATGTAGSNAGSAAGGASAAANNAAIIAGMLGEKLKMEATGLSYENDYLQDPNAPKSWWGLGGAYSKEEFTQHMANLKDHDFDKYRENRWRSLAQVTAGELHPEWGPDERKAYADRAMKQLLDENGNLKDSVYKKQNIIDDTILGPGMKTLAKQIEAAYDQSQVGEYGGGKDTGSGGSGGGGDGSGGDGSGSGSGSTRNRVDLVLCNKKTIPKLNVNLFKKPPQFKINNKQFSIRDININTQDKPNAMADAVKDSIIRTQQRMDPKIVQDEQAVYDPAAATDGTPKGKTPVDTTTG